MAANIEYQLISRVLDFSDFNTVQKARITEEFFFEALCKQVFCFIRDHYLSRHTYGSVPSWEIVLNRYPAFQKGYSNDTVATLCEQLHQAKMSSQLITLADQLYQVAAVDPRMGLDVVREHSALLSSQHEVSNDLLMSDAYEPLRREYDLVASGQGLLGIPWPWEVVNDETQGIQGGQFIVLFGRPKNMKCVVEGQRIMMRDGALVPIEQVPEQCEVPSFTQKNGVIRWASARRVVSGVKQSVEVVTESGLRLRTSTEHLYMVPGYGYKRICDLKPGDYIATARTLPTWDASSNISADEGRLLGILTGDGNYTRAEVQFTTADEEILTFVKTAAQELFGCELSSGSRGIEYRIISSEGSRNRLLDRLRELGMHGKKAPKKEVPEDIYRSSKEAVLGFISGLLDTDGHVSSSAAIWNSSSRKLLEGVKHLLGRFKVRGSIGEVTTNRGTLAYTLTVYSKEQHKILNLLLGPYLCLRVKRDALRRLASLDIVEKRNKDSVPYSDSLMSKILAAKNNKPWPQWGSSKLDASKLFRRSGNISRHLLQILAESFDSAELLQEAWSDIIWERIDTVEDIGEQKCFDICIIDGQDPNFVVEDFVVHNTWVGLAIAAHAYINAKQRVLVISMEMKSLDIQRRAASVCAKVDYQKLRKATLQPYDCDRFFQWLQWLKDAEHQAAATGGHQPALLATSGMGAGIGAVQAKIYEFKPDLVIVDGLYRMKDDRTRSRSIDWKNVTNVVQDLNETAKSLNIPIIGITQANRASAKSSPKDADVSEMAFADALGQECDMAIRVKREIDPQSHEAEIIMSFPATREYTVENVVIHGLPGVNFGFKRVYVPQAAPDPGQQQNGGGGKKQGQTQSGGGGLPGGGRVAPKPNFSNY